MYVVLYANAQDREREIAKEFAAFQDARWKRRRRKRRRRRKPGKVEKRILS